MVKRVYRRTEVTELFGISNAYLYKLISKGQFPKADVKLGTQTVAWSEELLEKHRESLIAPSPKEAA